MNNETMNNETMGKQTWQTPEIVDLDVADKTLKDLDSQEAGSTYAPS